MSVPSLLPLIEPDGDRTDRVVALLRALGIEEISYTLDGGGDSGESNLEAVRYRDGRDESTLPCVAIGFLSDGRATTLDAYLGNLAEDLPEGDWVNNEGGYGTVSIYPFEPDFGDRFCCDMTYREEYDDEDGDDDTDDLDEVAFGEIVLDALGGSAVADLPQVVS